MNNTAENDFSAFLKVNWLPYTGMVGKCMMLNFLRI